MCISTALSSSTIQISNIDLMVDAYHGEVIVLLKLTGKVTKETLLLAKSYLEEVMAESSEKSLRFIVDATKFKGWEYDAFLEDIKLGVKHRNDVDKIAFCGHQHWQEVVVELANTVMNAEIQYFERLAEAELWASL